MDELCPLCLKTGDKRKIKAIQVNLLEALWMCENEECPWPFGYEKPEIFSRKVGEKWSFEWQIHRKVRKSVGPIAVSAELSLYTPPVTPSGDAAAKDPTKTDLSDATNISDSSANSDIFLRNSTPRDSYAPRSAEIAKKCSKSAKAVPFECKKDSETTTSVLSSIFDIDGDELLSNKIGVEPASPLRELSGCDALDAGSGADRVDAVLEKSRERLEISVEKSLEIKKPTVASPVNSDGKELPSVRSIVKTNIDLQKLASSTIIQKETKPEVESLEKPLQCPFDTAPATPPSDSGDRLHIPKQHTTTITVEGIPGITLSYDLADLAEKPETTLSATSTPMQKKSKRRCSVFEVKNNVHDTIPEVPTELPKKQAKLAVQRRAANGKKYEKFSFSALRKTTQDSKDCNEKSTFPVNTTKAAKPSEIADENELLTNRNLQELSSCNSRVEFNAASSEINAPCIVPLSTSCSVETTDNPNQTDESLTLLNLDSNNLLVNDNQSDENLNLSCFLDDMLLEGCQNATKNLEDDWLESFFT